MFLFSYGVVLLVVFLIFSTVAKENVSGYYDWRKDLPSAAFHFTDFRDSELAWGRIAYDATAPWIYESPPKDEPSAKGKWSRNPWHELAKKLMNAREKAGVPLNQERRERAEIQLLRSLPW